MNPEILWNMTFVAYAEGFFLPVSPSGALPPVAAAVASLGACSGGRGAASAGCVAAEVASAGAAAASAGGASACGISTGGTSAGIAAASAGCVAAVVASTAGAPVGAFAAASEGAVWLCAGSAVGETAKPSRRTTTQGAAIGNRMLLMFGTIARFRWIRRFHATLSRAAGSMSPSDLPYGLNPRRPEGASAETSIIGSRTFPDPQFRQSAKHGRLPRCASDWRTWTAKHPSSDRSATYGTAIGAVTSY